MTGRKIPLRDVCAGLFVVALGAFAAWEASSYPFGSLNSIGSGFFPVMLGLLAIPIGAAILWEAASRPRAHDADWEFEAFAVRPVAAVAGALFAFALLIDRAGLVPAIVAATSVAALAERTSRPLGVVLLASALALLCAAIFVFALKLPIRVFAW